MPVLAPVAGVCKFVQIYNVNGREIQNQFYVNTSGSTSAWSAADITTMASAISASCVSHLVPLLNPSTVYGIVDGQDLTSVTGAVGSHTVSVTGTSFGTIAPINTACCVSWLIPRHYRGGHPRTYLGGFSDSAFHDEKNWDGTFQANVLTWATDLLAAVAATSLVRSGTPQMVAVHRGPHTAPYPTPLVDVISAAVVRARIDSQRRRLPKSG